MAKAEAAYANNAEMTRDLASKTNWQSMQKMMKKTLEHAKDMKRVFEDKK